MEADNSDSSIDRLAASPMRRRRFLAVVMGLVQRPRQPRRRPSRYARRSAGDSPAGLAPSRNDPTDPAAPFTAGSRRPAHFRSDATERRNRLPTCTASTLGISSSYLGP